MNKASGYYGYPDAWTEKQSGRWLHSGDIGTIDDDGYLTFVGRNDDMINVGGLKVAPEEVETELASLLAGATFSVAQIPDPAAIEGVVPGLFFETEDAAPVDLAAVRDHLRARLPEFKIPRAIHTLPQFPRTETTNKIRRAGLAEAAIVAERAALPNTSKLMAQVMRAERGNWPAFEGDVSISYRRLASLLSVGDSPFVKNQCLAGALEWMRAITSTDDATFGRAILQSETVFGGAGPIGVGIPMPWPPIVQAVAIRTLAENSTCVLYRPLERMLVAEDLGWLRMHGIKDLIVDGERLERIAAAENHLQDTFDFPSFGNLFVIGEPPNADALNQFHRNFEFLPQHLVRSRNVWTARKLFPPPDGNTEDGDHWRLLCEVAAAVFEIFIEFLDVNSSAETTPGWNSLGFVSLIMAVEERFGVRFTPKDIMSVRRLSDLETLVAQKT